MKIKSLLIGMLACSALVACTNENEPENNGLENAGNGKDFVAVNIVTPTGVQGRAASDYQAGSESEVYVKDAVFLFLDGNYNGCATPYYVGQDKLPANSWTDANEEGLDKKATLLVVENDKEVPSYIVAILNPVGGAQHGYTASTSLSDLKGVHSSYTSYTSNNFVMSNAAYHAVNGKEAIATPITVDDIYQNEDDAKENPVTIQVERVVSKVIVDGLDAAVTVLNTNGLTEQIDDQEDMALEFVLTGWNVLQNIETNLIKNVNATGWTIPNWNAHALGRSWWAEDYEAAGRTVFKVNDATALTNTDFKYVEETVNQEAVAASAMNNQNPYLLVAGYFQDAEKKTAVDLVEWKGQKYTKEGYLNLIAGNAEVSKFYTKSNDGTKDIYTSVSASALELVDNTENDWGATAGLTAAAAAETYYTVTFKADGVTIDTAEEADIADLKSAIAKFGEVQYWNGGNTYYWVPIQHQAGSEGLNYYGVVRNHIYKMNITKISGYGTPVSDPNQGIDIPEKPTEEKSYLAADIVILDWKVVNNNNVELGE